MLRSPIDLTQLPVAPALDWRVEFGLWLRRTPTQKRKARSRLTVEAYERDVDQLMQWWTGSGMGQQHNMLSREALETYFMALDTASAPATYNRKLASVRMLVKWAQGIGILEDDPAQWIPFVDATRKSPRDVSDQERSRLEAAAEGGEGSTLGLRDSLIFFLMSNVGLRINEVVTLQLEDVRELDKGVIHVRGKGGKHRSPKVAGRTEALIRRWISVMPHSVEGRLITDEHGLSIRREQAWRRFAALAARAEVNTTPHAMRHTFVIRYMQAYMQGDPWRLPAAIDAVCQQTGDRPEVILAYYTRARESDMRAAAEAM